MRRLVATAWPPARSEVAACPTCGPTKAERHPRRGQVLRCVNCREWLAAASDNESVRPDGADQ